ncbi:MAG TPA: hypothetical protein VMG08_10965 [Allosphingosinicella sp.]|nr:hypothetical protein [Allosphingosinicella sp.]
MKKTILIAALIAGQVIGGVGPASAQGFAPVRDVETGAFGGVRLRIPFGGSGAEPVRAGLAFAPTARADYQDGRVRTRIGEGLEFGYRTDRPLSFSLAGRDFSAYRLNAGQGDGESGRSGGVPTWVIVTGGVVLALGVAYLVFEDAMNDASE